MMINNYSPISETTIKGQTAEMYVKYNLSSQGCITCDVYGGLPYDMIVIIDPKLLNDGSNGLKRLQVKSTHNGSRTFSITHKAPRKTYNIDGKTTNVLSDRLFMPYNINDCDYFSFVDMSTRRIAYYKPKDLLDKKINDDYTLRKSITINDIDFDSHSKLRIG